MQIRLQAKEFAKEIKIDDFDGVPLTFDMLMSHTVDTVEQKTINIRTTGHEKVNFTCVLAVTAEGYKLPPMLIFKMKTVLKEKFPRGIVVKVNPKGWMDRNMMHVWLNSCNRWFFLDKEGTVNNGLYASASYRGSKEKS